MSHFGVHRIRIDSPDVTGLGTRAYLDDVPVKGLQDIDLHIGVTEPTRLTLTGIVDGAAVEVGGEVVYHLALVLGQDKPVVGKGASVLEALRALIAAVEAA